MVCTGLQDNCDVVSTLLQLKKKYSFTIFCIIKIIVYNAYLIGHGQLNTYKWLKIFISHTTKCTSFSTGLIYLIPILLIVILFMAAYYKEDRSIEEPTKND